MPVAAPRPRILSVVRRSSQSRPPVFVASAQLTDAPDIEIKFRSDYTLPILLGDDSYDAARAQIWQEYVKEATAFDEKLVKAWNETLDVMLIFAALFSAVVTAFLVAIMVSPYPGPTTASCSVTSIWFLSLSGSLLVSVAIMHVKYWIFSYTQTDMSTPRERARLRQYRYEGLQRWQLRLIIDLLPIWLQGTVLFFLAGLVVFLWSADNVLGGIVIATIGLTIFVYSVMTTLPTIFLDCPFVSPLSYIISYAAGVGGKVVTASTQSRQQHSSAGNRSRRDLESAGEHFTQSSSDGHIEISHLETKDYGNSDCGNQAMSPLAGGVLPSPPESVTSHVSSERGSEAAILVEARPRPMLSPLQTHGAPRPLRRPRSAYVNVMDGPPITPVPLISSDAAATAIPQAAPIRRRKAKQIRRHSSGIFIPQSQRTRQMESIKERKEEFDAIALEWLLTYSAKEEVQEDALLAFIAWEIPEPPTAKWKGVHETIVNAANHAFYHRMRSLSTECDLRARMVEQLPRLAGLCNVALGKEQYSGRRILPSCIKPLFEVAEGKNYTNEERTQADPQSLELLACVVLLHLKHHWSLDYREFPGLDQLVEKCVRLFENPTDLPLYGSCMFLNYMALRRMGDLHSELKKVLCNFMHDMTSERHGPDDEVPFHLERVLQHLQNRLPSDTPPIYSIKGSANVPDTPTVRFLLTPPAEAEHNP